MQNDLLGKVVLEDIVLQQREVPGGWLESVNLLGPVTSHKRNSCGSDIRPNIENDAGRDGRRRHRQNAIHLFLVKGAINEELPAHSMVTCIDEIPGSVFGRKYDLSEA